jgi:hypothetical protein
MARPYGDAMPTETTSHSGDGLLALIAVAVIVVVAAEAVFIAYSSWWLLVFVLLGAITATGGVITALSKLIGKDEHVAH